MKSPYAGLFDSPEQTFMGFSAGYTPVAVDELSTTVHEVRAALLPAEASALVKATAAAPWAPAPIDGYHTRFEGGLAYSWRATCFSDTFASILWDRLSKSALKLPEVPGWQPCEVSNLMRFMRYTDGGMLIPHYDFSYEFSASKKTLVTLVLVLETPETGGATRFIDPGSSTSEADWARPPAPEEVLFTTDAKPGDMVVFPHNTLHDSEPTRGLSPKTIMRTDLVYKKV